MLTRTLTTRYSILKHKFFRNQQQKYQITMSSHQIFDREHSDSADVRSLMSMMEEGIPPQRLLSFLAPHLRIPPQADDMTLWRMLLSFIDPPKRKKLPQYNTLEDAVNLIKKSSKIMVQSGAGISTAAGLPDFRSRNGIYVQIHAEHPDLADPKSMFDIDYFLRNPLPFYQFAKALYPGQYTPTLGHKFIKCIEDNNKLLRNYTQNIDTLERQAGIKRVVECHGSFSKATCTSCKYCVDGDVIRDDIMNQRIPLCPKCHESGSNPTTNLSVMKPNIVFFGEQLGNEFHYSFEEDKDKPDLLIVIGSSLKVKPVAMIPNSIPANVPQILINKEPLDHMNFDIELLGDCDHIIEELCLRLGGPWAKIQPFRKSSLKEVIGIPQDSSEQRKNQVRDSSAQPGSSADKKTSVEEFSKPREVPDKKELDDVSMASGKISHGSDSPKSCRADKNSSSTTQIDGDLTELEENKEDTTNSDKSDEDWEDVEVLHDSSDSLSPSLIDDSRSRAEIKIPDDSYIFLKPNHYLFQGAELTNGQLAKFTKA